jgi:lipoate-protein ligase A
LEELELWIDDAERDGWRNMAVDDWLLETARRPVLRIYRWEPGWGSFGYFVPLAEAVALLPGLKLVRRRTGGGIVDHRKDLTYTLVVPSGHPLADQRGGASYRFIHEALASALSPEDPDLRLAGGAVAVRGGDCFAQPVEHDLLDHKGSKIAGAGQRRSADGLLHQGSVAHLPDSGFASRFAACLAGKVEHFQEGPGLPEIESRARRFRDPRWAARR